MSLKRLGLKSLEGKTIQHLVVSNSPGPSPLTQVFLVFTDGTYFEFYGEDLHCASEYTEGGSEDVLTYAKQCQGTPEGIF